MKGFHEPRRLNLVHLSAILSFGPKFCQGQDDVAAVLDSMEYRLKEAFRLGRSM